MNTVDATIDATTGTSVYTQTMPTQFSVTPIRNERKLFVIQVGDDTFTPTKADIDSLKETFQSALESNTDAVVLTSIPISFSECWISDDTEIKVIPAYSSLSK